MSLEDEEAQKDELEVLESIYGDDFQLLEFGAGTNSYSFVIHLHGADAVNIELKVHFPVFYPSKDKPIVEIVDSSGLTVSMTESILEALDTLHDESMGQVYMYEWIESVRQLCTEAVLAQSSPSVKHVATSTPDDQVDKQLNIASPSKLLPHIYHAEPFIDRKSTFQAHVCPVTCIEEMNEFRCILLQNKKIARATHNIEAYRITGKVIIKDNDDDGESGAGSKLAHLLELTCVENVAVIVSRWYGGIKLGPDRFKHINNCARSALEECGYIVARNSKGKKRTNK